MPRINTNVRTRDQIIEDNVGGYINWALDQRGYQRQRILRELSVRYPNANRASLEAAYNQVLESRRAGQRQMRLEPIETLANADIPINRNLGNNYRYFVKVEWRRNSQAPWEGYYVYVDSPILMTQRQLEAQAYNLMTAAVRNRTADQEQYNLSVQPLEKTRFTVMMVERLPARR